MRQTKLSIALFMLVALVYMSCQDDNAVADRAVSADVLDRIADMGFDNRDVQKTEEGYLVEGDIILTEEDLGDITDHLDLRIAGTEQYRTTNLVTGLPRTITVSIDPKLTVIPGYADALTIALARYNAENLLLHFQHVGASGGQIHLKKQGGNFLASAGFPSGGNPYPQIKLNSNAIGSGNTTTFKNYCATIIAHEMGHCVGYRHTDYMDRAYSCGIGGNEGSAGVGAIHIPGTPSDPDAGSWMLACISQNQNRPFNNNDRTALSYIY